MLPVKRAARVPAGRACDQAHCTDALQGTAGTDTLRKDLLLAGFVDTASSTPVFASPEASAVAVRLVEEDLR